MLTNTALQEDLKYLLQFYLHFQMSFKEISSLGIFVITPLSS